MKVTDPNCKERQESKQSTYDSFVYGRKSWAVCYPIYVSFLCQWPNNIFEAQRARTIDYFLFLVKKTREKWKIFTRRRKRVLFTSLQQRAKFAVDHRCDREWVASARVSGAPEKFLVRSKISVLPTWRNSQSTLVKIYSLKISSIHYFVFLKTTNQYILPISESPSLAKIWTIVIKWSSI